MRNKVREANAAVTWIRGRTTKPSKRRPWHEVQAGVVFCGFGERLEDVERWESDSVDPPEHEKCAWCRSRQQRAS